MEIFPFFFEFSIFPNFKIFFRPLLQKNKLATNAL